MFADTHEYQEMTDDTNGLKNKICNNTLMKM